MGIAESQQAKQYEQTSAQNNNTVNHKTNNMEENQEINDPSVAIFELTMNTLKEMGCQPNAEGDSKITVQYQGENFMIEVNNVYIRIWDLGWLSVGHDNENLQDLIEAINIANRGFGATILYSGPHDDGKVMIHSRRDILMIPQIPDIDAYLKSALESFFDTKAGLRKCYENVKQQNEHDAEASRHNDLTDINPN